MFPITVTMLNGVVYISGDDVCSKIYFFSDGICQSTGALRTTVWQQATPDVSGISAERSTVRSM